MRRTIASQPLCCTLVCAAVVLSSVAASAVTIPTVAVGNPVNARDPGTGNDYGAVGYEYRMGTTEVTNAQYVAFLNSKAATDPLSLYSPAMASNARGGITRAGSSGSFTYTTKANMADKPVNFVDWYDAIRFANWLHNGQGTGDTETGAYTLEGGNSVPGNFASITRNPGAIWFLPSEDEWYKAAYHQPATQGGDTDSYWLYATASNTLPTVATANAVGDISNPGANVANYLTGADWNSQDGNVTTVGSAGPLSKSFYGTVDQTGNVWEWNESLNTGNTRGLRGGSLGSLVGAVPSSNRDSVNPTTLVYTVGFRVATVPEPSTAVLGIFGFALLLWLRKRMK